MSTETISAKRLVRITPGNIKNGHIYLNGAAELFPKDSLGASAAKKGLGRPVELLVAGLTEPVVTDLPRDEESGRATPCRSSGSSGTAGAGRKAEHALTGSATPKAAPMHVWLRSCAPSS